MYIKTLYACMQVPVVAYLDTDCGQPEFTAPGLVSLHMLDGPALGPPHVHQRQPLACHFVGDVTPQSDPDLYLQAVQSLYGQYCSHAAEYAATAAGAGRWPPLLVNTHGWVKGLGFDLLVQLMQTICPTHVLQLRGAAGSDKKHLPPGAFWLDDPAQQQQGGSGVPPLPAMIALPSMTGDLPLQQQPQGSGACPTGPGQQQRQQQQAAAAAAAQQQQRLLARMLRPVESRALTWHAWAKRCTGADAAR